MQTPSRLNDLHRPLPQPLYRRRMDAWRRHQHPEGFAARRVEGQRLAERAADRRAGFLGDEGGGGDVPFEAPFEGRDKVRLACGDEGDAECDRIGLGDHDEILVGPRKLIGGDARAGQFGARRDPEAGAVAPAALADGGGPQLAAHRGGEDSDHRHPVLDQGDRDAPAGAVAEEIAGAVDRVDDPEPPPLDPVADVDRLLGKPAGLGIEKREMLAKKNVDLEIDVADGMARRKSGLWHLG